MLKRVLLLLFLALAIFGGLAATKYVQVQRMTQKLSAPQPPTPVAVAIVERVQWPRSLTAVGSVSAVQDVTVTTEVAGQVESIRFESGAQVAAGDVLVTLDASIDAAELAGLEATLRLAELQYARAEKLRREHTMSESQYDEAAAKRAEAAALVRAKQAHIAKKTIRAPIGGTLGIRRIDLGDYLAPGAEIVGLQSLDTVFVDYRLPERDLGRIRVGQQIDVRVQAYPERRFSGVVTAIDPAIDVATRMVKLRARLPNPESLLRPGMFAEVDTREERSDEVLVVPATAITYSPYGDSVYLVTEADGGLKVKRQQVETGETRAGFVAVTSGVAAGDRVVAVGQNKLRNDVAVVIAPDTEQAAADAPAAGR
ncbi:MAG TPA: efflux RND transporter periplasmic adaptor subunit [Gammaproteobacteria bacterium]|nr:efflux RND transporter periplasmic adaptor subunit [Gammaproteobacteria bacterium]